MRKEVADISIRRMRKQKGITQQALADAIGVKQESVSQWETGTYLPNMKQLVLMAKELNCSVDELVTPDESG